MEANQASEMPVYETEEVFRLVWHFPQGDVHKRWHRMMKKQNLRQGTRCVVSYYPMRIMDVTLNRSSPHHNPRIYPATTHVPKNPGGIPLEVDVVDDAGPSNIGLLCDRRGLFSPKRKRKRKKRKRKKKRQA